MSSMCQNTCLNSPLMDVFFLEAWDSYHHNTKARNGRITAIKKDIEALNHIMELPERFSTFTQNLQIVFSSTPLQKLEPKALEYWKMVFRKASIITSAKTEVLTSHHLKYSDVKTKLNNILEHPRWEELMSLYSWRWTFEQLIVATSRPKNVTRRYGSELNPHLIYINPTGKNPIFSTTHADTYQLVASSSFIYIYESGSDQTWISSREHLLQLNDSCIQRYNTLLSGILGEIFEDATIPSAECSLRVMRWGDSILNEFGNNGYKSIKMWEPLFTAYLINFKEDEFVNTRTYRARMIEEFIASQGHEQSENMRRRYQQLETILDRYINGEANLLSQLFGLYRFWGHPTVDGLSGINKLRELVQHHHSINHSSVNIVTRKWREYFSFSYYSKNGSWPKIDPVSFDRKRLNYTLNALKEGLPIDRSHSEYHDYHWDDVVFSKTFEVPEKFEFSEMISDKATSFDKTQLRQSCQDKGTIGASCDRSVIIRWLRSNYQNPLDFLNNIGENGFDPESNVAGVYPKEREGKNAPRLFGLMTLQRRLYIVITEALIADFILKYFPEITMTFDHSTLMTRLHTVTKDVHQNEDRQKKSIITNIDFEKWNSNMREEETRNIFTDFDRLFGLTNVFSRSHELFEGCTFYLADGSITPRWTEEGEMLEGVGVWNHHLGGIEGLRQKGWTVFTVVILKYICDLCQVTCQLMGQGDNQVLITHYYPAPGRPVHQQHEEFLQSLSKFLDTIGPPLKLEESWSSSHYFTYGKFPILDGVPLTMSLKRMSRCSRMNNEGIANLDSVLSSISANTSAAVSLSRHPYIPLLISYMESISAIHLYIRYPFYGESLIPSSQSSLKVRIPTLPGAQRIKVSKIQPWLFRVLEKELLLCLLLCWIPSALGGFPILQASELMMHGFHDPVTAAIWECKELYRCLPENCSHSKDSILKVLNPEFNTHRNPELLCQDPTCLNLLKCSRPQDQRRRLVFNHLTKIPGVVNNSFLQFFEHAQKEQNELADLLYTMNPCHPRICASVYESTPTGRAQAVIKKIEKTTTLETILSADMDRVKKEHEERLEVQGELFSGRPVRNLGDLNYLFEKNQMSSILLILNRTKAPLTVLERCSTRTAHSWRIDSWGKDLRGVTVAVPMELIRETCASDCQEGTHPNPDLGYIRCQNDLKGDPKRAFTSIGCFRPFFGSTTIEKIKYEGGQIVAMLPPIIKVALKNFRLVNWGTTEDSRLTQLLVAIFQTMTDAEWRPLIPAEGMASGTLEHRWADSRTDHSTSPGFSYVASTHFTLNTNSFKPEVAITEGDDDNVNISMQSLFSFIASFNISKCLLSTDPLESTTHWHVNCKDCIIPVNEEMIDIDGGELFETVVNLLNNYPRTDVSWVPRERLEEERRALVHRETTPLLQWNGDLQGLFDISVVGWIFENFPTMADKSLEWKYLESTCMIPVSIVLKVNPLNLIRNLASLMILRSIYTRSAYWYKLKMIKDKKFVIETEIRRLSHLPVNWFIPLNSLFLSNSLYQMVLDHFPQVPLPKGCPPNAEEKASCLKWLFGEALMELSSSDSLKERITSIKENGVVESSLNIFHPEVLVVIERWLDCDRSNSYPMKVLMEIREYEQSIQRRDRGNTLSLMDNVSEWTQFERDVSLESQKMSIVRGSPDCIAKLLGRRAHPDTRVNVNTAPQYHTLRSLENLPISTHHVFYNPSSHRGSMTMDSASIDLVQSSINHLFKRPLVVTTAAYKLVSVLKLMTTIGQLPSRRVFKILCCGDGTGGFSVIMGQLYPGCKIIYNSYYHIPNQSSVGCDRFVPAAVMGSRMNFEDLLGVLDVIEGVSDLTSSKFPEFIEFKHQDVSIITCDAEGESSRCVTKLMKITENLIMTSNRCGTELLIIKTYLSRTDLVIAQMQMLKNNFKFVNCVRTFFSGYGNTEVYLTASSRLQNKKEMKWEIIGNEKIRITGDILSFHDYCRIREQLICIPFEKFCDEMSVPYTKFLKKGGHDVGLGASWKVLLEQLKSLEVRDFPLTLVNVLQDEFSLVKFHPHNKTFLRKHLLTIPIVKKLLTHYLLWVTQDMIPDELIHFESDVRDLYFTIYETVLGKWSMIISDRIDWGRKFKTHQIKDLVDPEFWRLLYGLKRDIKVYLNGKLTWNLYGSNKLPYTPKMVTDFKDWKVRIGTECASFSILPAPKKGNSIVVTSGRLKGIQSNIQNHQEVSILYRLLKEKSATAATQSIKTWMSQNITVTASELRFRNQVNFLQRRHGFLMTPSTFLASQARESAKKNLRAFSLQRDDIEDLGPFQEDYPSD